MTGQGDAERVRGAWVAGNYFQLLGVRPTLGRLIDPRDDTPASPRVAVLAFGFFSARFGNDPAVVGTTLMLDGQAYTVVGVLPPEVRIANRDVIVPIGHFVKTPMFARENHPGLIGIGRLRPGVTLEQARADLQRVSTDLQAEYPKENTGIGSGGAPLMELVVGRI